METMRKHRRIKSFDELTITDDFMFGAVMSDPKRCKLLLEYILNIRIVRIDYKERQKTINVSYDSKGVRLDLTVIDDKGQVFDIEIQTSNNENLPLRIRYYHDMLDLDMLDKSMNYNKLNRCFVIFFDMFGKNRYMYTFKRQCQEDSSVFLEDKAVSVVLNTAGKVGEIDPELKDALHYMAGQVPSGKFAKDIDKAVRIIKSDEKWRSGYMTYAIRMKEREIIAEKRGEIKNLITTIRKRRGKRSVDDIIDFLDITREQFDEISEMIDSNPDWTDEDIAYELTEKDNSQ